jgi:hypothetical protein
MDIRLLFSAMAGVLCVVIIVATITTVRHLTNKTPTTVLVERR